MNVLKTYVTAYGSSFVAPQRLAPKLCARCVIMQHTRIKQTLLKLYWSDGFCALFRANAAKTQTNFYLQTKRAKSMRKIFHDARSTRALFVLCAFVSCELFRRQFRWMARGCARCPDSQGLTICAPPLRCRWRKRIFPLNVHSMMQSSDA